MAPPSKKRRVSPPPYPLPSSSLNTSDSFGMPINVNDWVDGFWQHALQQIEAMPATAEEFKNPSLPLARIKKVMKTDEEVKMIAQEVPILLSKACELFIYELTGRAYIVADASKRRTITKEDIYRATEREADHLDFLVDIMHRVKPRVSAVVSTPPENQEEEDEPEDTALSKEVFSLVGRAIEERKDREKEKEKEVEDEDDLMGIFTREE